MRTKEILQAWRTFTNQSHINERVSLNMNQKLRDISSSNTDFLSQYNLQLKMNSLPVLIIDINNNITKRDPDFLQLLNMFEEDPNLSNRYEDTEDVANGIDGRLLFQWENNKQVLSSLLKVLQHFDALDASTLNQQDIQNSSLIIFKEQSFNEDDPYSRDSSSIEKGIYDNAMWTLHDVMHRINEDLFPDHNRTFIDKSFEYLPEFEFSERFFKIVSQAISHSSDKFTKHLFSTGEDFTPSFMIFLYMYIIEVDNNKINITKSHLNLKQFLRSVYKIESGDISQNELERMKFVSSIAKVTKNILTDINIVLEKNKSIQLQLYKKF